MNEIDKTDYHLIVYLKSEKYSNRFINVKQ